MRIWIHPECPQDALAHDPGSSRGLDGQLACDLASDGIDADDNLADHARLVLSPDLDPDPVVVYIHRLRATAELESGVTLSRLRINPCQRASARVVDVRPRECPYRVGPDPDVVQPVLRAGHLNQARSILFDPRDARVRSNGPDTSFTRCHPKHGLGHGLRLASHGVESR